MTYHDGEIEVQRRAGVRQMADRIGRGIREDIPAAAATFLAEQRLAILAAEDADSRIWVSPITGEPGFLRALDARTIRIEGRPVAGDPLDAAWDKPRDAGLVILDFATRRRMRVNGWAEKSGAGLVVHTREVYSNCPKYIQARDLVPAPISHEPRDPAKLQTSLTSAQTQMIESADTFFAGSRHPEAGADASHRGGNPGFVRVMDDRTLLWPDYSGNTMFQTLGNIESTGRAGLLFPDFDDGTTLQLTGRARIVWDTPADGVPGAERLVEFRIETLVETPNALPLRGGPVEFSPFNPR